MKYADFAAGFVFRHDGETYTATDSPSNNGNFTATDNRGRVQHFNAADVLRAAEYKHPSHDESGRKICRKCGEIIKSGINGAAMLEICFDCTPPPRYPQPSSRPRTIYDPQEEDAAEARARRINFDFE